MIAPVAFILLGAGLGALIGFRWGAGPFLRAEPGSQWEHAPILLTLLVFWPVALWYLIRGLVCLVIGAALGAAAGSVIAAALSRRPLRTGLRGPRWRHGAGEPAAPVWTLSQLLDEQEPEDPARDR